MATLTTAELTELRGLVGADEPPTDGELDALFDTLGTVDAVAHVILNQRLNALLAKPTKVTFDGDVTEDWSGNVAALQKRVASLGATVEPTEVTTGQLRRLGRRR